MGSTPIFSKTNDPYGPSGRSPTQIDTLIGSAYDVVREVAENLEYIKHLSAHLAQIYRVYQSIDGLDVLYENIEGLEELLAHIDEIIAVATNITDVVTVSENLEVIYMLSESMVQLQDIYEALDEITAAGGTVIVSDNPPDTEVNGKLWWESDSGALYAYYNDGSSSQWVQINIANPKYDWSEITNKPSTFPPAAHTHGEYVRDTGDTMTGNLVIATPATLNATLSLRGLGVTANMVLGQTAQTSGSFADRWAVILGNTRVESGTSTGSDFEIRRHDNTGKIIDSPISIERGTGFPNFINGLTTPTRGVTDDSTFVATTAFVNRAVGSFNDISGWIFKVYGKTAIYIPPDEIINKTSVAYGDGLRYSTSTIAPEGQYNTALGFGTLFDLTSGNSNAAGGARSGANITTGNKNTSFGASSLQGLTTGSGNTALGYATLYGDPAAVGDPSTPTDWDFNTAIGYTAIYEIASGARYNVGIGVSALSNPSVSKGLAGSYNNGVGGSVIHNIESGGYNNAFGYAAFADLVSGSNNIALGHNTGRGLITGSGNVIIGHNIVGLVADLNNTLIIGAGNQAKLIVGSPTGVSILGTTTNDLGPSGYVGEYLEYNIGSASAIVLTTNVAKTIGQMTLTAGDWDVFGWIAYNTALTTSMTRVQASVSMTSNVIDNTTPGASYNEQYAAVVPGATTAFRTMVGHRRVSLASSSVVYLTTLGTFTLGALSAWGKIWARRVR